MSAQTLPLVRPAAQPPSSCKISRVPNSDRRAVQKGDLVIFNSYAGTEIKIEDEDFLIMTESDVLGIVD